MTYTLLRGNTNHLAGEAVVYTKCTPIKKKPFLMALFISSDDVRLDDFSTLTDKESYEIQGELCSVLPRRFNSEKEIFDQNVRNIIRPAIFIHKTEDSAVDSCKEEALNYMRTYYSQINKDYGLDFKDPIYRVEHPKVLNSNLDFLVEKMLEGYEINDLHGAQAAASIIRRIGEIYRESYKDFELITEWAADTKRPFNRIKRITLNLKNKIKISQQGDYCAGEQLREELKDPPA